MQEKLPNLTEFKEINFHLENIVRELMYVYSSVGFYGMDLLKIVASHIRIETEKSIEETIKLTQK